VIPTLVDLRLTRNGEFHLATVKIAIGGDMGKSTLFQGDTEKEAAVPPAPSPGLSLPLITAGCEIPLPEHLDHPAVRVFCATCPAFGRERVEECEEGHCCWAWARRGHEQRVKDDARNRAEKEGNCEA
jgi:hypothetical protein